MASYPDFAINLSAVWLNRDNLSAFFSFSHQQPPFLGKAPSPRKASYPSQLVPTTSEEADHRATPILLRCIGLVNNGRIGAWLSSFSFTNGEVVY
jgi:hypothetical protein